MQPANNISNVVHCVLSDCDGVIVDSEKIADAIMVEVLQEAFMGHSLDAHMTDMFGRRVSDILRLLERRLGVSLSSEKRLCLQQDIDARVAHEAAAMPHVKEIYESLGMPIAIVSNSAPQRLHKSVRRAGLAGLVGTNMFSGDEVKSPKPAPDVYLQASRALGIDPAHCLAIEDSVTGVKAARAAGMRVLGFLGGSHIRPDHANMLVRAGAVKVFNNMVELPQTIENISRYASSRGPIFT